MAKKKKPVPKKSATRKKGPSGKEEFASKSAHMKGSDIKEPFDAVITDLNKVEFDDGKKWVLELEGHKSIVLNNTNGLSLVADIGDRMDGWTGQQIHIFTERRRNPTTGQMVPAVAVCGSEDVDDEADDLPDDDDSDLE